jgi:prephenate dehydrogenase
MSGGYFDYVQHRISGAADSLERYIARCESGDPDMYGDTVEQPPEVLAKLRDCERTVRRAAAMLHRVDYLLSFDDSEGSFLKRWNDEGLDNEAVK